MATDIRALTMRRWLRVLICGGIALLIGTTPLSRAGAQAQESVLAGYLSVTSFAPLFVAMDKGFYEEVGLKVRLVRFASGGQMVLPAATGQIEVSSGSASAALFNAIAQGMDFKVVADKGQTAPGYGYIPLVIRKDLVESGRVKGIKDVAGLRIALPGRAQVNNYALDKMLEEAKVPREAVSLTYLDMPTTITALQNRAIDGVLSIEPWGTRAQLAGVGVIFTTPDKFESLKRLQLAYITYAGKFIRERPAAARNFMKAYIKGIQYYNKRGMTDPEIMQILEKYTRVPVSIIKISIPFYLSNDGRPLLESLAKFQDWLFETGQIKQKVPMEKVVDLSFLK